jgi:hypothetical protein
MTGHQWQALTRVSILTTLQAARLGGWTWQMALTVGLGQLKDVMVEWIDSSDPFAILGEVSALVYAQSKLAQVSLGIHIDTPSQCRKEDCFSVFDVSSASASADWASWMIYGSEEGRENVVRRDLGQKLFVYVQDAVSVLRILALSELVGSL